MLYRTDGTIQSADPPETLFGYLYFSSLIPPFKPQSMLVLGAGKRTVEKLTYKIWGNIPTISVDKEDGEFITKSDAFKFAREYEGEAEYVVVDIWDGDIIPEAVFEEGFIADLHRITKKLLAVNVWKEHLPKMIKYGSLFNLQLAKELNDNRLLFFTPKDK